MCCAATRGGRSCLRTGTDGKGITGAHKVATALEGGQSKVAGALRARVTVERRHGLARA